MPGGRPTAYQAAFAAQAEKSCRLGATDRELADLFEVDEATINRWKQAHPEFCESLKRGKGEADASVADRLYQRAMGYSHEAVKIFMPAGADEPVYAPYTEHYAPDTTAAIFWLKNRRPDLWRDVQGRVHTGRDGGPVKIARDVEERVAESRRILDETFRIIEGGKSSDANH